MSKEQKRPEIMKLSNRRVKDFRKLPQLAGDRVLKPDNVYELLTDIGAHIDDDVTLTTIPWASVYVRDIGIKFRVNGNHTSSVLLGFDLRTLRPIWVCMDEFEVDTLDEAHDLYLKFDKKTSSKRINDHHKVLHPSSELRELPISHYSALLSGLVLATKGAMARRKETLSERARMITLPEYHSFCLWYSKLVSSSKHGGMPAEILLRSPVIASNYKHWCDNKKMCKTFWQDVREGKGEKPSLPVRQLYTFLTNSKMGGGTTLLELGTGRIKLNDQKKININCVINVCDQAWEAYRAGKATVSLMYDESPFKQCS